jgi:hypothetical protein
LIVLQVQAKFGDYNKDVHKPGILVKERVVPQRYKLHASYQCVSVPAMLACSTLESWTSTS